VFVGEVLGDDVVAPGAAAEGGGGGEPVKEAAAGGGGAGLVDDQPADGKCQACLADMLVVVGMQCAAVAFAFEFEVGLGDFRASSKVCSRTRPARGTFFLC
jgi:hypothetical protein